MKFRNLFGASSALGSGKRRLAAATTMTVIAAAFALGAAPAASADTSSITFEPPLYRAGDINGQDGWSKTGPFDVNVVDSTGSGYTGFGTQSLQVSNAVTSGSFGDQTFSKSLTDEAGESTATNNSYSGGLRQSHFDASFAIGSAVAGYQPGMSMSVSPDRGDGARMSYLRFVDQSDGIHVFFDGYVDAAPFGATGSEANGCGTEDDFAETDIATLTHNAVHTIRFSMDFVEGPRNDVVQIYVDGALQTTGTSWEDYFRWCENTGTSRTVDSLLFRTAGTAVSANVGNGYLFDNVNLTSGPTSGITTLGVCPVSVSGTNPTVYTLLADCTTDRTIVVPQNGGGSTFDGASHSITGVDPTGGHFVGAVVQAAAGADPITVENLTVTVSSLSDSCDGGADRLRGILFDGVSGTISGNTVTDLEQGAGGASGCQEGNAIDVRNTAGTSTSPKPNVVISNNTVTDYQKTGIIATLYVAATITNNTITGDGPINYIAQNGIQVSYGATAVVKLNSSSGNNYTPSSYVACGFLIYKAGGVKASSNTLFNNEKNMCNFGKGGGTFKPSS